MTNTHEQFINEFVKKYNAKTPRSKERAQLNRTHLSDCRASAGFRFSTKELLYQIVAKKGRGSYFYDIDNNKYIDIAMGFGVLLFGHYPKFISRTIKNEASKGIQLGAESKYTYETAQLFCELTGHDKVTFCNSGTEANMTAIRLARLHTGRHKIVIFTGSYHGFYDATLVVPDESTPLISYPLSKGLIPEIEEDVLLLEYGNIEQLNLLEKHKNAIAAIIVEPVRSRAPDSQHAGFLQALRDYANSYQAVLIFDEVITGFRSSLGGAQRYFNVSADLATYGKILGGGLPIGAIGGRSDIMSGIDGGFWQYGDQSYPSEETTFFAGTFSKNPLVMATAHAILTELKSKGPSLQSNLNVKTKNMVTELNEFMRMQQIPIHVANFSSLFRFEINANADLFYYLLLHHGIYVWEGRNFFLSTAHSDKDIKQIIATIKKCAVIFNENGFLRHTKQYTSVKKQESPMLQIAVEKQEPAKLSFALSDGQKDLFDLIIKNEAAKIAYNEGILVGFNGTLDTKRLIEAFGCVCNLHQAFRIQFAHDGREQYVSEKVASNVPVYDIQHYPLDEKIKFIRDWSYKCINTNFNLVQDTLFRIEITKLSENFHVLVLIMPNIIMDGISGEKMFHDWFALYNGKNEEISILPYSDYIAYQNNIFKKSEHLHSYWLNLFKNSHIERLQLAGSKPRPAVMSFRGDHHLFDIGNDTLKKLRSVALQHQTTLFVLMMSLYFTHLRSYHRSSDIMVGVPFANRYSKETYNTFGFCISLMPIILRINAVKNFADVVNYVKTMFFDIVDHSNVPISQLLPHTGIKCDDRHPVIFDTLFNMESLGGMTLNGCDKVQFASMTSPYAQLDLAEVGGGLFKVSSGHSQFDLTLNVLEDTDQLHCCWEYNTDIFTENDIQRHTRELLNLIAQLVNSPEQSISFGIDKLSA